MQVRPLSVEGALEITAPQFPDDRGVFFAPFQAEPLAEAIGHPLTIAQTNVSVSRRGAFRGLHFSEVPPSQAKLVTVLHGAILDFVVDVRVGSPTFGQWDSVLLDTVDRRTVYVPEGMGHAMFALEDDSAAFYHCSTPFAPGREHGIDPLDPDLGLAIPEGIAPILSAKDAEAPSFAQMQASGLLPSYAACQELYASLS